MKLSESSTAHRIKIINMPNNISESVSSIIPTEDIKTEPPTSEAHFKRNNFMNTMNNLSPEDRKRITDYITGDKLTNIPIGIYFPPNYKKNIESHLIVTTELNPVNIREYIIEPIKNLVVGDYLANEISHLKKPILDRIRQFEERISDGKWINACMKYIKYHEQAHQTQEIRFKTYNVINQFERDTISTTKLEENSYYYDLDNINVNHLQILALKEAQSDIVSLRNFVKTDNISKSEIMLMIELGLLCISNNITNEILLAPNNIKKLYSKILHDVIYLDDPHTNALALLITKKPNMFKLIKTQEINPDEFEQLFVSGLEQFVTDPDTFVAEISSDKFFLDLDKELMSYVNQENNAISEFRKKYNIEPGTEGKFIGEGG